MTRQSYAVAQPCFVRAGTGFEPTPATLSGWGPNMVAGPPVLGLLARTIEVDFGDSDFFAARLTADLFRPVRVERTFVGSRIIRWGNRIRLVEAELIQSGEPVARATAVFYRKSRNSPGQRWADPRVPKPPASTEYPDARLVGTSGDDSVWVPLPCDGPPWSGAGRKRLWATGWSVIDGEPPTPFARTAMVSDLTSLVANSGTAGVGYINGDVTLALTRLPTGNALGLEARTHHACDGIAVSSATLFDRDGVFGECTATGLANEPRGASAQTPDLESAEPGNRVR
ncbi:thioesterase family protein [Nocardia fluminea]|uniref:thioesterase family protein n=1 Tax=Nocardia fluminea TaxID=134984 RepID=UPI0033EC8EB6